jgi:hypothetical protein
VSTQPEPLHIPLTAAYLCQDCNCVSNCSRQCPACASQVLMGLAGVLNREEAPESDSEPSVTPWEIEAADAWMEKALT